MKILLAAPPFSGHLHPMIAIAKRLSEDKTLDITVVSTLAAKKRIEKENIKFIPILEGYDEKIDLIANPPTKIKSNPFKLYNQLKENISILNVLKKEFEIVVNNIKPDLIIADFTLPIIGIVANEKGIKWHTTLPSPCVYECNGVPAYLGGLYPPTSVIQRTKYKLYNQCIKLFKKSCYWLFKKQLQEINLSSLYDKEGNETIYSKNKVYALGMSELEFNQPSQKQFQYVGPLLYSPILEHETNITFEKNKKYVLVTMGTHLKFMKKELIKEIQALAFYYPELEFHITMGEDIESINENRNNVKILNYISYEKYLDKYSYVIHHGGTGIIYECIKRGISSIVFPQDYDQFDNASRLDYYGLSVKVEKFSQLNVCFQRLIGDDKLIKRNNNYQQLFYQYEATETIYKEIKKLQVM